MARRVFGVGPVAELVRARARTIEVVFVAGHRKGKREGDDPVARLVADARSRGIEVIASERAELDALAGGGERHQGVVAIAGEFGYADLHAELDRVIAAGRAPLVVALDSVQDPRNVGAIVRSAYLLGADVVLLPRDRAAHVTPAVTKTSAGATELVAIAQATNLARALEDLKARELWVAGVATAAGARPLWELDADRGLCLVLGSEGRGIRPLVSKVCDFHVEIPMAGAGVGSFNVAVAAGIALYEIARQRASRRQPT